MSEIVWEDPPPPKGGPGTQYQDPRIIAMKAHAGKWLLWGEYRSHGMVWNLRNRGFEVSIRTVESSNPKRYRIYARWPDV